MRKWKSIKIQRKGLENCGKLKIVEVVPVVIRTLESVTKEFDEWIEKLGITSNIRVMQKIALLELRGC